MADIQEIAQVASRAYEDPEFALELLGGTPDVPEVRDAILRDLAAAYPDEPDEFTSIDADGTDPTELRQRLRDGLRQGDMNVARLSERARSW